MCVAAIASSNNYRGTRVPAWYRNVQQERQYTYNVTLRRVRVTSYRGKAVLYNCECVRARVRGYVRMCVRVVARTGERAWAWACACSRVPVLSSMQRAAVLSSATSLPPLYFSTLSHKRYDFQKKKLLNIKRVFRFSLQLLFETFLILRSIQRDTVVVWKRPHAKYPFFLSNLDETWIFSTDFRKKKAQISSFLQIRPVGAELSQVDGRTDRDMTMLTVAFRYFANAPKAHHYVLIPTHCVSTAVPQLAVPGDTH